MARPSIKQAMVAGWLAERRRGTARDVAYGLQLSVRDAVKVLDRLQQVGQITVLERVRADHAKRPVAVYGPAQATRAAIFSDDWLRSR
jgi:hypothetical protein